MCRSAIQSHFPGSHIYGEVNETNDETEGRTLLLAPVDLTAPKVAAGKNATELTPWFLRQFLWRFLLRFRCPAVTWSRSGAWRRASRFNIHSLHLLLPQHQSHRSVRSAWLDHWMQYGCVDVEYATSAGRELQLTFNASCHEHTWFLMPHHIHNWLLDYFFIRQGK